MPKLDNRGVVTHALMLVILVVGVAAGVYLVKTPQILKTNAADTENSVMESIQGALTEVAFSNCTDSDEGRNPGTTGTIYLKGKKYNSDFCNFNDSPAFKNKKVLEYWCESPNSTVVKQEWIDCSGGCNNGACITASVTSPKTLFAYYYDWYSGSPPYLHWSDNNHTPPADLYSAYYPHLGPYDSGDINVIDQHMRWLKVAKVDVILVSFWGKDHQWSKEATIDKIINKAGQYGIKVAFMLEPKKAAEHLASIAYLVDRYGNNTAFYKVVRPTLYGKSTSPRPTFWIYQPMMAYQDSRITPDQIKADFRSKIDTLRGTAYDSIILIENTKEAMLTPDGPKYDLDQYHSDGMFNYDADIDYAGKTFAKSSNYIAAVQVAPGFDNRKAGGDIVIDRQKGQKYDSMWSEVARQKPEWVVVLSFNEWGEGTQIEPAKAYPANYLDYQGHYNYPGFISLAAYLWRTAYWVDQYKKD
ncbi:glycoside hydrolase family 99-like domain-containing protein [Candidatus Daviesbacteria bacterium]|nr:glycoside hydrolase family 99-like domain-containing protein [Candidatus Daviesbacteria bacterium]